MAKKKDLVTEPATDAALQWYFGIVSEPPSDRVGKEYLARYLPKRYRLENDTLVDKKTGLSVAPKQLAEDQGKAKKSFHIARADFANKAALKSASVDQSEKIEFVEDPNRSSLSSQLELRSMSDAVASSAPQARVTISDEGLAVNRFGIIKPDLGTGENSLAKAYSSFTINDRSAARDYHLAFLSDSGLISGITQHGDDGSEEAARTTPIFSGKLLDGSELGIFNQYGLLCKLVAMRDGQHLPESTAPRLPSVFNEDPRIFLNVNAPWSTFICGSQGSGKSYTLSCILENCLIPSGLGQLPNPLAAIVFHYDTFTSYGSRQLCEAAYLCSSGVPVTVLVSPTNFWQMKQMYENLPLSSSSMRKPKVVSMKFQNKHLDVTRMMSMMAMSDKDGPIPLYIEVILRILREMAIESQGAPGLDYDAFRKRVDGEAFTGQQITPLKLRLDLLESFMDRHSKAADNAWDFEPGTLTIVDLSCPFVDESSACALFSICLDLFLEYRNTAGRIVALDEAHKFMKSTATATDFTDKLLQLIRQQRHLATRVVISTQEPTVSPRLLDLCTVTIVHRFTSPEWFRTLHKHLASVSTLDEMEGRSSSTFGEIVDLEPGEALIFCPSAMLEPVENKAPKKLGMGWLKVRVRRRLTEDGGRSMLAA